MAETLEGPGFGRRVLHTLQDLCAIADAVRAVPRYLLGSILMLGGVVIPLAIAASRTMRRGVSLRSTDR
jgi:hypothetical protein